MRLPDYRAHSIVLNAALLESELKALNLGSDASERLWRLIDRLRDDANALRDDLSPGVPARCIAASGNVVRLRR